MRFPRRMRMRGFYVLLAAFLFVIIGLYAGEFSWFVLVVSLVAALPVTAVVAWKTQPDDEARAHGGEGS